MSASKCARCDKTVYPVEGLRCLDKLWHKGCFKCHECSMTLNMKNYKGFEKRPYCNAHCPQAKATTVADTPEIRRLAENTRIQSQAKYHEDFEKSKGKNFTTIADDPETRRIKETSKIISNACYHGDMEKKKHMEEKRNSTGQEEVPITRVNSNNGPMSNNNNYKHQNRMQSSNNSNNTQQGFDHHDMTPTHQQAQQQHQQKQYQQRLIHQQQLQLKQQYVQPAMNRQASALLDNHQLQQQQQTAPRGVQQQSYPANHQQQIQLQLHQQQQQQLLMRQQQHQQQIIMQQHRQSMDASIPMARQVSKQAIISGADHPMMKHPNMIRGQTQQHQQQQQQQQQQQLKYMPLNDHHPTNGQPLPQHLVGVPPHIMNPLGPGAGNGIMQQQQQHNRRLVPNSYPSGQHQLDAATQQHHAMMQGYNSHQVGSMNGIMPKQHVGSMQAAPHIIQHPDQMHAQQRLQMRPVTIAGQPMQQLAHPVPRRVFRAIYDYVANDVDEVSFLENDILVDCVNVDRNWLIGKVARSGQTGMLPANYVEPLPSQ